MKKRRNPLIVILFTIIVVITIGFVAFKIKATIITSNVNRQNNKGLSILVKDNKAISVIKKAITTEIKDSIERDIIVCKKIDEYYFVLIDYQNYDNKSKQFDGAGFNNVYVFKDTGKNGIKMLASTGKEKAYSPGFGVGISKYNNYEIIYGNLNKTAWIPEIDAKRETNYNKMVISYDDGNTYIENVYGCTGFLIVSKMPNSITSFILKDKNGKTAKDDKFDMRDIKTLDLQTEFKSRGTVN